MGFVDRDKARRVLAKRIEEGLRDQALGGHIEDLELALAQAAEDGLMDLVWQRAVDARGGDPAFSQSVDLVLHQRDEGRDYDGVPIGGDCGGLEAEGFSAAGGQDNDGVAPIQYGLDGLLLEGEEGVVSPEFLERVQDGVHWVLGCSTERRFVSRQQVGGETGNRHDLARGRDRLRRGHYSGAGGLGKGKILTQRREGAETQGRWGTTDYTDIADF